MAGQKISGKVSREMGVSRTFSVRVCFFWCFVLFGFSSCLLFFFALSVKCRTNNKAKIAVQYEILRE
jgi:hypothetical protein